MYLLKYRGERTNNNGVDFMKEWSNDQSKTGS